MRTFGISKRFSPKSSAQSNRGFVLSGRFRRFGQQSIFFKYRITHQSNFYSNQLNMYHFKTLQNSCRSYNSSSDTSESAEDFWYSVTRPSKKFCSFLTSIISASQGNGFSKPGLSISKPTPLRRRSAM